MKKALYPFRFATVSYLIRICNQKATSLSELQRGLAECSYASIFFHTFHRLRGTQQRFIPLPLRYLATAAPSEDHRFLAPVLNMPGALGP